MPQRFAGNKTRGVSIRNAGSRWSRCIAARWMKRKVKLQIPLIGEDGIPRRDEIELEMILNQKATHLEDASHLSIARRPVLA
jgi:hypothetical protein